ncbi:MAG TPA: ZIP family metal transporter [Pirellulales bacterium]|nr:ZIP family metal transporter [Pirellulales bacterium]
MSLWLIYCPLIVLSSLAGGFAPHLVKLTHVRMQLAISFIGGAMLGVGLLNLLPHALYAWKPNVNAPVYWLLAGFLAMFFVERVFHFHHHDAPGETEHACGHEHHEGHVHEESHHHGHEHQSRRLTWPAAFVGLALHSALDGLALAASVRAESQANWAGAVVFFVIFLHKPFDSLTLGTLMAVADRPTGQRHRVNVLYALAVPLGAALYNLVADRMGADGAHLTGAALAFSAGTFLCIATSDLLPELQFHSHDRGKLSLALLAGVLLAALLAYFEEGSHSHEHDHAPAVHGEHTSHSDHDHADSE